VRKAVFAATVLVALIFASTALAQAWSWTGYFEDSGLGTTKGPCIWTYAGVDEACSSSYTWNVSAFNFSCANGGDGAGLNVGFQNSARIRGLIYGGNGSCNVQGETTPADVSMSGSLIAQTLWWSWGINGITYGTAWATG